MNKTVAFRTLGCKVNQYESEALSQLFEKSGYKVVDFDEKADVYVINTCTVTGMSARKSRQMIRMAKKTNPKAIVAVIGCYSQTQPTEVSKIDGVDIVLGTQRRSELLEHVMQLEGAGKVMVHVSDVHAKKEYEDFGISTYKGRSRAYVKVQDGCSQFCSYCIIPYARGPVRSRHPERVLEEVERLAEEGFSEIVLTGIHIASYGKDLKNIGFMELIKMIHEIEKVRRIRLSSLEPGLMTDRFIKEAVSLPKLCPHFHISLQSGCDETLKRMNRKYNCRQYEGIVRKLVDASADVAITTDIMVGFPGETGEEFEKTVQFLRRLPLAGMHVFKYSSRKGTPAATFKNQVPPDVKKARSKRLLEMASAKKAEFYKRFEGRKMEVLFEEPLPGNPGWLAGMTPNYIKAAAPASAGLIGEIREVTLVRAEKDWMAGEL